MYGLSSLILIILPLLFQIIAGRKAIGETISLKFGMVCLISFILQIVLSIASFYVTSYPYTQNLADREYRCGMWMLGWIVSCMFFFLLLFITIIIQYFIKRSYEK